MGEKLTLSREPRGRSVTPRARSTRARDPERSASARLRERRSESARLRNAHVSNGEGTRLDPRSAALRAAIIRALPPFPARGAGGAGTRAPGAASREPVIARFAAFSTAAAGVGGGQPRGVSPPRLRGGAPRGPFRAHRLDYVKVTADGTRANGARNVPRAAFRARASGPSGAFSFAPRACAPLASHLAPTRARAPLTFPNLRARPSPSSSDVRENNLFDAGGRFSNRIFTGKAGKRRRRPRAIGFAFPGKSSAVVVRSFRRGA